MKLIIEAEKNIPSNQSNLVPSKEIGSSDARDKFQSLLKILLMLSIFLSVGCFSRMPREIEPDDPLERELRAEPERFRDSESREFKEKEESKKGMKKK